MKFSEILLNARLNSSSDNLHVFSKPIGKYQKTTHLTLILIKINNYTNFVT